MMRHSVLLALLAAVVTSPVVTSTHAAQSTSVESAEPVDLEVFVRSDCSACERARAYLDDLQEQRPALHIRVSNVIEDPAALSRLQSLAESHNVKEVATPTFVVRGQLVVGWAEPESTGRYLEALLDGRPAESSAATGETCSLETSCQISAPIRNTVNVPLLGPLDIASVGLPLFTAVIGLLDGFNPCAMWVLVFVLSLLASTRSRPMMLLIAGTFVFVSGLIYFAFMAAWLNVFLLVGLTRQIQIVLGAFALIAGALNAKDFVSFGRGPSLSIPSRAKPSIYRQVNRIVRAERVWLALVGVAALALMVNTVELLCTAGLPAIYTQVLASQQLVSWQYYAYLVGYQFFYMFDDMVVLSIGVITLSRHRLQQREGRWLKLVSAGVMAALAATLLFQPSWLEWTV